MLCNFSSGRERCNCSQTQPARSPGIASPCWAPQDSDDDLGLPCLAPSLPLAADGSCPPRSFQAIWAFCRLWVTMKLSHRLVGRSAPRVQVKQ